MLLIILMILIDRFKHRLPILDNLDLEKYKAFFRIVPVVIISLLLTSGVKGQASQLQFKILKNDKSIGTLKIEKVQTEPYTDYQLSSTVETSFIKKFHVKASEKSRYKDEQLVYSSVNRSINNKSNHPKELVYEKNQYFIEDADGRRVYDHPEINTNMVILYFKEPLNLSSVYCDNQQSMVEIKNLGENRYRIDFPDGNANVFYYEQGECVQVDVFSKLFKVKLLRQ